MTEHTQKSRLGSLLIKKGLLSQTQLDTALKAQIGSGLRLGEVLIAQGMLSEKQLQKALKKQSRHRLWATIIAVVLGPMSFSAFANQNTANDNEPTSSSLMGEYQGLKALEDAELASIQGQGFQTTQEALNSLINQAQGELDEDQLGALDEIVTLLNPIANVLDADISVNGVKHHPNAQTKLNADGSLQLALPSEIEEIAFRNLRVKGDTSGRNFGDVVISGIRFSEQSSIRISVH